MAHHDRTIFGGWIRWIARNLCQWFPEYRRFLVEGYAVLLTVASRLCFVPLELQFGHGAPSVLLPLATSGHFWVGPTLALSCGAPAPSAMIAVLRQLQRLVRQRLTALFLECSTRDRSSGREHSRSPYAVAPLPYGPSVGWPTGNGLLPHA